MNKYLFIFSAILVLGIAYFSPASAATIYTVPSAGSTYWLQSCGGGCTQVRTYNVSSSVDAFLQDVTIQGEGVFNSPSSFTSIAHLLNASGTILATSSLYVAANGGGDIADWNFGTSTLMTAGTDYQMQVSYYSGTGDWFTGGDLLLLGDTGTGSCDTVTPVTMLSPASSSVITRDFSYWNVSSTLSEGCNYNINIIAKRDGTTQTTWQNTYNIRITPDTTENTFFKVFKQQNLWNYYLGTSTLFDYNLNIQNADDNIYLGSEDGSFMLTYNAGTSSTPPSNIPPSYNPELPCGGLGHCNTGNGSIYYATSTDANSICGSTTTWNLWDLSTWSCGIINITNNLASDTTEQFYFITNNTVTQLQGTFLFNPIYSLNVDIAAARAGLASSTDDVVTIGNGSSTIYGGHIFTIMSSSTTSWIKEKTGFDYRALLTNIMYFGTGIIMLMSTIKIIAGLTNTNQS